MYDDYIDLTNKLEKIAQNRANLAKYGESGYQFIKQFEVSGYLDQLKSI